MNFERNRWRRSVRYEGELDSETDCSWKQNRNNWLFTIVRADDLRLWDLIF